MQLRHLQTFVAIADNGTLTAAADVLYKTQGAVSQDLRGLEGELGTTLIDRSGQRIQLTAAGVALLPQARELLQRVRDVEHAMGRIRRGEAGFVRIGCLPSMSVRLATVISELIARHPEIRIGLHTDLQSYLLDALERSELDLVVAEPVLRDDFAAVELGEEPMLLVFERGDPLTAQESVVAPRDIGHRRLVGFFREVGSTRLAEEFFEAVGYYPDPLVEVDDYKVMQQLIRCGVGFGVMPVSTLIDVDDLAWVAPEPPLRRRWVLLRSVRRVLPEIVNETHDFLAERFRPPGLAALAPDQSITPGGAESDRGRAGLRTSPARG